MMFPFRELLWRTSKLLVLMMVTLMGVEIYWLNTEWSRTKAIQDFNRLHSHRNSETQAYPSLSPLSYLSNFNQLAQTKEQKLFPLSGLPFSHTVVCKEEDELQYYSDRYGFNNNDTQWNKLKMDLAFLGDSYVHGYCVKAQNHFLYSLTSKYSVLNLGLYGSGPLSELAILTEYAALKKPKIVFWTYMSNDLSEDLPLEESNHFLFNYLQGKSQNLAQQTLVLQQVQQNYLSQIQNSNSNSSHLISPLLAFFTFSQTRAHLLNLFLQNTRRPHFPKQQFFDYISNRPINWLLYKKILIQAKKQIHQWDGKLIFLYLPDASQWNPHHREKILIFKQKLFSLLQEIGIDTLDFTSSLEKEKNPLEFYSVFRGQYGHLNHQGQTALAQFLLEAIPKK